MPKTPEGYVKDIIKERLADAFGEALWTFWPVQTGFGKHGVPDLLFCVSGLFCAIEAKPLDGDEPTGRQKAQIRGIEEAGGLVWVVGRVHTFPEVHAQMDSIIKQIEFLVAQREEL